MRKSVIRIKNQLLTPPYYIELVAKLEQVKVLEFNIDIRLGDDPVKLAKEIAGGRKYILRPMLQRGNFDEVKAQTGCGRLPGQEYMLIVIDQRPA